MGVYLNGRKRKRTKPKKYCFIHCLRVFEPYRSVGEGSGQENGKMAKFQCGPDNRSKLVDDLVQTVHQNTGNNKCRTIVYSKLREKICKRYTNEIRSNLKE